MKIDENKNILINGDKLKLNKTELPELALAENIDTELAGEIMAINEKKAVFKSQKMLNDENILSVKAQKKAEQERQSIKQTIARLKNRLSDNLSRTAAMNELASDGFSIGKISVDILNSVVSEIEKVPDEQATENAVRLVTEKIDKIENLTEGEIASIIKSEKSLTLKNVYSGKFSGEIIEGREDGIKWEDVSEELKKGIREETADENLSAAKFLFDRDLPVIPENVEKYKFLKDMKNNLSRQKLIQEAISMLHKDENILDIKITTDKNEEQRQSQINRYEQVIEKLSGISSKETGGESDKVISFKRQIAEISLKLTKEAAYRLAQKDIKIDTLPLEKALASLKAIENEKYHRNLSIMGAEITPENVGEMAQVFDALPAFKNLNNSVYGDLIQNKINFNIAEVAEAHEQGNILKLAGVIEDMEKYSSAPNPKYGDSFSKIISSFAPLLKSLNLPDNDNFVKAAGILSKNKMDITEENILKTVTLDEKIQRIYNTLHPNIAAALIHDGLSPKNMHIDDLLSYIENFNGVYGDDLGDKIAGCIIELDKKGELSQEDSKKMRDIYKMLNKIMKNDSVALGVSLKNGVDATIGNLLNASKYFSKTKGVTNLIDMFAHPTENDMLKHRININSVRRFAEKSQPDNLYEIIREPYRDKRIFDLANKIEEIDKTLHSPDSPKTETTKSAGIEKREALAAVINEAETAGKEVFDALAKNAVPITMGNIVFAKKYLKDEFFAFKELSQLSEREYPEIFKVLQELNEEPPSEKGIQNAISLLDNCLEAAEKGATVEKIGAVRKALDFMGRIKIGRGFYSPILHKGEFKGLKVYVINENLDLKNIEKENSIEAAVIIDGEKPLKAQINILKNNEISVTSEEELPEQIVAAIKNLFDDQSKNAEGEGIYADKY